MHGIRTFVATSASRNIRKIVYRVKINVLQKRREEEYRPPQGLVIYRDVACLLEMPAE